MVIIKIEEIMRIKRNLMIETKQCQETYLIEDLEALVEAIAVTIAFPEADTIALVESIILLEAGVEAGIEIII